MELVFIWICFGVVTALAAQSRGRSFGGWLVIGMLTGIFGLIAVLVMGREEPVQAAADQRPAYVPRTNPAPDTSPDPAPRNNATQAPNAPLQLRGDGSYGITVSQTEHFQIDLGMIADSPGTEGMRKPATALLVPDDQNREVDGKVRVRINKRMVGYLGDDSARRLRTALIMQGIKATSVEAFALISWDRQQGFQVRLDIGLPLAFEPA